MRLSLDKGWRVNHSLGTLQCSIKIFERLGYRSLWIDTCVSFGVTLGLELDACVTRWSVVRKGTNWSFCSSSQWIVWHIFDATTLPLDYFRSIFDRVEGSFWVLSPSLLSQIISVNWAQIEIVLEPEWGDIGLGDLDLLECWGNIFGTLSSCMFEHANLFSVGGGCRHLANNANTGYQTSVLDLLVWGLGGQWLWHLNLISDVGWRWGNIGDEIVVQDNLLKWLFGVTQDLLAVHIFGQTIFLQTILLLGVRLSCNRQECLDWSLEITYLGLVSAWELYLFDNWDLKLNWVLNYLARVYHLFSMFWKVFRIYFVNLVKYGLNLTKLAISQYNHLVCPNDGHSHVLPGVGNDGASQYVRVLFHKALLIVTEVCEELRILSKKLCSFVGWLILI